MRSTLGHERSSAGRHQQKPLMSTYDHSTRQVLLPPVEPGQYLSIRYTERLEEAGAVASVGSKGDSYDNALAESFNGLYKTELIHRRGPWKNADDVEWATLIYIDWFNNRRIHSSLGDLSPAEFEAAFYNETESANQAASETSESLRNPV